MTIRAFRSYWVLATLANTGTWAQVVAVGWLVTLQSPSGAGTSLLQLAGALPFVLFVLPGGVLADRVPLRRAFVFVQCAAALVAAAGALALWSGSASLPVLVALVFASGSCAAVAAPLLELIVARLVPPAQLAVAEAADGLGLDLGRGAGSAIGGILTAVAPWLGLAYDAVVSAAFVAAAPLVPPAAAATPSREGLRTSVRLAWGYVANAPLLRQLLARTFAFAFGSSALWALLPVVSRADGGDARSYGLLLAVVAVGSLVATRVLGVFRDRSGNEVWFGTVAFAAVTIGLGAPLPIGAVGGLLLVAGAAYLLVMTGFGVSAQRLSQGWIKGRALAVYQLAFQAGIAGGSAVTALCVRAFGPSVTLVVFGVVTACSLLVPAALDRAPAVLDAEPPAPVDAGVEALRGHVLEHVTYLVRDDRHDEFRALLVALERSRRRVGALSSQVYRDPQRPQRYLEVVRYASWAEREAAVARRSVFDLDVVQRLEAMLEEPVRSEQFEDARMARHASTGSA